MCYKVFLILLVYFFFIFFVWKLKNYDVLLNIVICKYIILYGCRILEIFLIVFIKNDIEIILIFDLLCSMVWDIWELFLW